MSGAQQSGRPGAAALRKVMAIYDDRRMVESQLELIILQAVRRGDVPAPVRQFAVLLDGRQVRLDLAWPDQMVFLEADGFGFHSSRAQFLVDRDRQNALVLAGWLPLRYTWPVAKNQPDVIIAQVAAALAARRR